VRIYQQRSDYGHRLEVGIVAGQFRRMALLFTGYEIPRRRKRATVVHRRLVIAALVENLRLDRLPTSAGRKELRRQKRAIR